MLTNVLKLLSGTPIPYLICGGYCRDTFFGVKPKDVDVCIQNRRFSHVVALLNAAGIDYVDYGESYAGDSKNGAHITRVITFLGNDLIFIRDDIPLEEITRHFDFNINQFVLDNETNLILYVGKGSYETLVQLHDDVPDERILKIYRKHRELIKHGKV